MNSHNNNAKSYNSLLALVDEIFPPASLVEQVRIGVYLGVV